MTMFERFLNQLRRRGLEVIEGDTPDSLKVRGPRSEVTPEVMTGLKVFKPEFLRRMRVSGSEAVRVSGSEAVKAEAAEPPAEGQPVRGESLPVLTQCQTCKARVNPKMAADVWAMCKRHPVRQGKQITASAGCPWMPNSNDMPA